MTPERLIQDLERQRAYCEKRSPLCAALLSALAGDLRGPEPAWFDGLSSAWGSRPVTTPYEIPLLILAALHYRALKEGDPELRPLFPTCGGAPGGDAGPRVLARLRELPPEFWAGVASSRLQTNEVARSIGWMLVASAGLVSRETPFHLVDLGTSGGLNLIGDYRARDCRLELADGSPAETPPRFGDAPYPVLSRIGLDAAPRRLEDEADRLWLKACIWPDDAARHARFDEAAALFVRLARERTGPRLFPRDFKDMPAFIAENVKPREDEGLLVYSSQATDFLDDGAYAGLAAGLAKALAPWGDRAFWVELELPRDKSSEFHQLRAHRVKDGRLVSATLATTAAHPSNVRLKGGWDFLAPFGPVRPPKVTLEEPPKRLSPGIYKFPQ